MRQVRMPRLRKTRSWAKFAKAGFEFQCVCCELLWAALPPTRVPPLPGPVSKWLSPPLPFPALKPAVLTWTPRMEDVTYETPSPRTGGLGEVPGRREVTPPFPTGEGRSECRGGRERKVIL